MLVLHSCTSKSFSGLERYVIDLVLAQHQAQKNVAIFCRANTPIEARARSLGIKTLVIDEKAKPGPLLWWQMRAFWPKLLAKNKVVLHMHAGGEPWYHWPWLFWRSKQLHKTILQFHLWINHNKNDFFHRKFYQLIDEIWCSSQSAQKHLLAILPVAAQKTFIIQYGRNLAQIAQYPAPTFRSRIRQKYNISDQAIVAVCATRIEPIKGVQELYDAFCQVAQTNPQAYLILIGGMSPDNAEAEVFFKNFNLQIAKLNQSIKSRLIITGALPEIWSHLAASDFYILPSYEECMSLAMLDAAVMGLPIIGTNAGGTPSIVLSDPKHPNGILVEPRNREQLVTAMTTLYNNPSLRAQMSLSIKKLASSVDQEKIFQTIWKQYQ